MQKIQMHIFTTKSAVLNCITFDSCSVNKYIDKKMALPKTQAGEAETLSSGLSSVCRLV